MFRFHKRLAVIFIATQFTVMTACTENGTESDAAVPATPPRPNILLIVADDLGYSDIGSYGGEIHTPVLDRLAQNGLRFTDFAAAPTCSTTRSMLLTGVDNHLNGLGGLDEGGVPRADDAAGYEGHLNFDVVTISSLLQDAGYRTYMAGKWHLGRTVETGPEARGFDRAFVNPGGSGDHFSGRGVVNVAPQIAYRDDGKPARVSEDFCSSRFFTDKLIEYINEDRDNGQPFFIYASYTAPHWPLQAPDEFIDKYQGVYEQGYDAVRNNRLRRLLDLGFIAAAPDLKISGAMARQWDELDETRKLREIRLMQVYAAMVEAMDHHIGRLLDYLQDTDVLADTIIIFISDNGAEGSDPYVIANNKTWIPENFTTDTPSLGRPGSYAAYGPGWAEVSSTPFRLYKTFTSEGGIRVPAIFSGPGLAKRGQITHECATVLDIAPTILDLAGADYPDGNYQGRQIHPLQGRSMLPYLTEQAVQIHPPDHVMGWELFNRRAVRKGGWKIVWIAPPYSEGRWELYNLAVDPFERNNLAASNPEKLAEMTTHWEEYAASNNVILEDYSALRYGNENHHYDH